MAAASELTKETTKSGAFARQTNSFTTPFGDGPGDLPVESGRYRLLVANICPWAHRQLIALNLLGLTDAISVGVAGPVRTDNGWRFTLDPDGRDPVLGFEYVTDAYLRADPHYDKRSTVPAVVDLKSGAVVNNDYHRLTNYWEVEWAPLHSANAPVLYPEELRTQIDDLNDYVFHNINNGVYKCGFARSQEAYEQAYDALFQALDTIEERLATRRFLFGDHITDADIRLWVTLVRFDAAYYGRFKTNRQRLVDFEHLWGMRGTCTRRLALARPPTSTISSRATMPRLRWSPTRSFPRVRIFQCGPSRTTVHACRRRPMRSSSSRGEATVWTHVTCAALSRNRCHLPSRGEASSEGR